MHGKNAFSLRVDVKGQVVTIHTTGPLSEDAGNQLVVVAQEKLDAGFTRFIIDFGHALTISSPSVAAILDTAEKIVDGKGGKLVVSGLTDLNMKVFEMVGIFLYAEACPTTQEAEVQVLL